MASPSAFPELDHLFGAYFNQDFDIWGDTIEEIAGAYKTSTGLEQRTALQDEIETLITEHPNDLESVFAARYGFDFDPKPWGYTTLSFLRKLQQLMN
jgi:hypothetical protein